MSSDSGPYPSLLGHPLHSETSALLTLVLARTGATGPREAATRFARVDGEGAVPCAE